VRLFARAECVVAPHGAGLSNLVFGERVSVIELFGARPGPHTFQWLAHSLGSRYRPVSGRDVGADLEADLAGLARALAELAEQP
jgi:hypothetical protein